MRFKLLTLALILAGCSTVRPLGSTEVQDQPKISSSIIKEINSLPAPDGPPLTVAVYGFKDLTGQRKPSNTLSLFSTAVTQGAEAYLIKTLVDAGNRQWFNVVERVGLDNLLKERQMIKQTREIYDGASARMLPPLTLAGVIIEGGIIDYNTNTLTGGTGMRVFGIGPQTQYTQDLVVINIRLVSVQTGEVLLSINIEKNLLSTADGVTALKFFNQATQSFEFDSSQTFNEPGNYALRSAIEQGVIEIIKQGERLNLWRYKGTRNELVQTPSQDQKTSNNTSMDKSNNGKTNGTIQESSEADRSREKSNRIPPEVNGEAATGRAVVK